MGPSLIGLTDHVERARAFRFTDSVAPRGLLRLGPLTAAITTLLVSSFIAGAASAQSLEQRERNRLRSHQYNAWVDATSDYISAEKEYSHDGRIGSDAHRTLADADAAMGGAEAVLLDEMNLAGETSAYITTPEYYRTSGPEVRFFLANQPKYSVPLGPIALPYGGAVVEEWVKYLYGSTPNQCPTKLVGLTAASGWANLYHPVSFAEYNVVSQSDPRDLFTTGFLARDIVMTSEGGSCSQDTSLAKANYVYRYRYFSPDGAQSLFVAAGGETPLLSQWNNNGCGSTATVSAPPTSFQSVDHLMTLDMTNQCVPVIHFADGSTQELHAAVGGGQVGTGTYAAPAPFYSFSGTCNMTTAVRHVDVNGNVTTYSFPDDNTRIVQDSRGRQTVMTFNSARELTSVSSPGPHGVPETYSVNWTSVSVDMSTAFPEIQCYGTPPEPCGTYVVPVVSSVRIPDGRSYAFSYGPWGNLTKVTEPDGAARTYSYGDSTNTAYGTASLALSSPVQQSNSCAYINVWSGQEANLQARGLVSASVYPQGTSNQGFTSTTSFTHTVVGSCTTDAAGGGVTGPPCCSQVWESVTAPDGTIAKTGFCTRSAGATYWSGTLPSGGPSIHGWELAEETWPSGASSPARATYYGDKTAGTLYDAYDTTTTYGLEFGPPVNRRHPIIVHLQDGVTTTSTTTFGDVLNGRNLMNVTAQCLWAGAATGCTSGSGTKLIETDSTYHHDANYNSRNILHLLATEQVLSPTTVLRSSAFSYDQFSPLAPSGQSGLDTTYTNAFRGNPTTATHYVTPTTGSGPVSSTTYYFDNGAAQKTQNPNDLAAGLYTTRLTSNFGQCSSNPTLTSTVENALGQSVSTVSDCYSGAVLSVLDANGNRACSQYDGLGRLVESAAAGDKLTTQTQCTSTSSPTSCFLRDATNCTTSGTVIGDNGVGPTTWIEYYPFGIGTTTYNQARTIVSSRDGTTDGLQHITFVDGLGRSIQNCAEADGRYSALSAGGVLGSGVTPAVCDGTSYDGMGRAYIKVVPFFVATVPTAADWTNADTEWTWTLATFDALGRVTSTQLMGQGVGQSGSTPELPPTTTAYSSSGNNWITTVTDANKCQVQTKTDALGHTVEHDVQNSVLNASGQCAGASSWLVTTMNYDAAGRLLTVTDPGSNQTTFQYDGLGRKTKMVDPDMGTWTYGYDLNGNLASQKDARGATINISYDALNRVWLKDLPYLMGTTWVNGPGEEDEVTYYDSPSSVPAGCYSNCDDHCSTTTDSCAAATLTCTHSGPTTGCPDQSSGCTPSCAGKCGGSDGCSGTCPNDCVNPQTCGGGGTADVCGCAPNCSGKCGGPDGCNGTCPNDCVGPQTCGGGGTADVCGCTSSCAGKCGGSDGCTGTCPNNCVSPQTCGGGGTPNVCGCTPSCSGKCGAADGCGGTCCEGNSNCTPVSCNPCTDGNGDPCFVPNACGSACTKVCSKCVG
jgi:YD repeat-containing protein